MIVSLAQAIPVKVRRVVYSVLGTLFGLELVFDLVPEGPEAKALAALAVFGFAGIALPNTTSPDDES